jgi:hypothetical protein
MIVTLTLVIIALMKKESFGSHSLELEGSNKKKSHQKP